MYRHDVARTTNRKYECSTKKLRYTQDVTPEQIVHKLKSEVENYSSAIFDLLI